MKERKDERRRTIQDIVVAYCCEKYFSLVEPWRLSRERESNEKDYLLDMIEKEPLVTVYTPTYNRAEILMERAIPSVLKQSYENFEYIIVGDCCTDKTEQLVNSVNDPRIRFINISIRKRRYPDHGDYVINHWLAGPVVAANVGLAAAKGKWIARLDDWAMWTDDHILDLFTFACAENKEFVTGASRLFEKGEWRRSPKHWFQGPNSYFRLPAREQENRVDVAVGGTQTIFYRSYLKFLKYNINCWRKKWNKVNDVDLFERIYLSGVRMGFLEKEVAILAPRPGEEYLSSKAFMSGIEKNRHHFRFGL